MKETKWIHCPICGNKTRLSRHTLCRYYKEDAKGVEAMSRIVEDIINSEKKEIALEFLKLNKLSLEEIAKCSKLSLEEVEEIAKDEGVLAG